MHGSQAFRADRHDRDCFSLLRLARVTLASVMLIHCLGCGPSRVPTYPAAGQVVFHDGEPVRTGLVELRSKHHPLNARGKIGRDGRFVLGTYEMDDGAVAGRHDAIVVQFLVADSMPEIEHDHGDPVESRFADYATSGLKIEIAESANELTIQVRRVE